MTLAASALALIGTISGGLLALGDHPPWASVERVAQIERRQDFGELNQVDAQIAALERDRRTRRLTQFEEDLLARLYRQRKVLCSQLRIEKC